MSEFQRDNRLQLTVVSFKFKKSAECGTKRRTATIVNLESDNHSEGLRSKFLESLGDDVDRRTLKVEECVAFTPHSGFMVYVDQDDYQEETDVQEGRDKTGSASGRANRRAAR